MSSNFIDDGNSLSSGVCSMKNSAFLDKLLKEWEDRKAKGLFHHDVELCESKVLPGEQFIVTLVEGRDQKKRRTEFGIDRVLQPFDDKKFNFTKVAPEEVLLSFRDEGSVLINVSPIGYGHALLVPRIGDRLPQRIDPHNFLLAMSMAEEAGNPFFRVGYNSLGAFATINHLHFQAYYLRAIYPVESAPTKCIATLSNGVSLAELLWYPVNGFVFYGGSSLQDLSDKVSGACIFLQERNLPFNVLISGCGKRVFLLPQCYAERMTSGEVAEDHLAMRLYPAVWELSGHLVLKRRADYDGASDTMVRRFLQTTGVPEARFEEIKGELLGLLLSG